MKRLLLLITIIASSLNGQTMPHQDKLATIQLANDLETFDRQIPYENHDDLYEFFCTQEHVMVSLIARINTLLNTYPNNHLLQGFIPLRNNLQSALDQIRNTHAMAAPVA